MLVIYRTDTLEIEQCVTVAAPDFRTMIEETPGLALLETDEVFAPHTIAVVAGADGPEVIERAQMDILGPSTCLVDEEIELSGIPEGTIVMSEGSSTTMDATGILDLSFDLAGTYRLAFSHPAYLFAEKSIEVGL